VTQTCTDTCCRPEQDGSDDVLISRTQHRARTSKPCVYCSGIQPGDVYVREFGLHDGEPYVVTLHDLGGFCVEADETTATHLSECLLVRYPGPEAHCTCRDYSPEWTT
jgi:hypothetical protein